MNNSKNLLIAILTGILLVGCSTNSTQSKVEKELQLGCEAINWEFGNIIEYRFQAAAPHFARAARLNSDYLELIDKLGESRTDNIRLGNFLRPSEQWILRFCADSGE
jgi:hypothetical protein